MEQGARDGVTDRVADAAGVGDRRLHHVGRDGEPGQLQGGRHRVAHLGGLRGTVGDLLREAEAPPEVRPMIRPQAPRAMCRRANSAIISAAAIASTLNCCRQVSAVTR